MHLYSYFCQVTNSFEPNLFGILFAFNIKKKQRNVRFFLFV